MIARNLLGTLPQKEPYPKFHNAGGHPIVRIGTREFECIGEPTPRGHPHVYLEMSRGGEIICSYCATRYVFDPSLGPAEANPPDCTDSS